MATGGLNTFRENLTYLGAGKQAAWGTAVAPTWFYRWLDGTDYNPEAKFQEERLGDTSPHISLVWKSAQYAMIKVVEYAYPIMAGYALEALCGASSDTYTAPTQSTTLAAAIVAGTNTFQSTASIGNASTLAVNFTPAYAGTSYEVQVVNLASRTGTGPYTYTLNGSATFQKAHNNGDTITSQSLHVFKRQAFGFDPYSFEFGWGVNAAGQTAPISQVVRVQDCVCNDLTISSDTGRKIKFEHTWYGAISTLKASPTVATYENPPLLGGPFQHFMASGNWTLDGLTTGNAVTIKQARLTLRNTATPEEFVTETLTPAYFLPGNFDAEVALTAVFNSFNQYLETYWGSASAAANATDSLITGEGAFLTTFTMDGVNSLAVNCPTVDWKAAKLSAKLSGKPISQAITGRARATATAADPFIATLTNSQAASY